MRIRSAEEIEDLAAGAEPTNRERRIKAGYRRLLRAVLDGKAKGQRPSSAECGVRTAEQSRKAHQRRLAAGDYLSRFLCAGFVAVLLATVGCVGPHPPKGSKATTTRSQAGLIQQTVAQGENAQQPSKQDQETIKVRGYTLAENSLGRAVGASWVASFFERSRL